MNTCEMTIYRKREFYMDGTPVIEEVRHPKTIDGVLRIWYRIPPLTRKELFYTVTTPDGNTLTEYEVEELYHAERSR